MINFVNKQMISPLSNRKICLDPQSYVRHILYRKNLLIHKITLLLDSNVSDRLNLLSNVSNPDP